MDNLHWTYPGESGLCISFENIILISTTEIMSSVMTAVEDSSSTTVPVISNPEVIEIARARIDKELDILNQASKAIRTLKTRRNALAPISRYLPPEVLSEIFAALKYALRLVLNKNMQWIRVTHVCWHWRSVALSCPSLWSYIDLSYPKWVLTMLGRSRMAPLVVKARIFPSVKIEDLSFAAIGHISRIFASSISVQVTGACK